jgi:Zn-dependent protease
MQVGGVDVYLHWSVLVVGCVILLGALERPAETLIAWTCYFSVLLIHEYGHVIMAKRKGCQVYAIELYPIHGLVRYSQPWSHYDDAVIAWGGVLTQAMVGIPLVVFDSIFEPTLTLAKVVIGVLGYFSILVAVGNLLPIRPLDGSKAWYVFSKAARRAERWRSRV